MFQDGSGSKSDLLVWCIFVSLDIGQTGFVHINFTFVAFLFSQQSVCVCVCSFFAGVELFSFFFFPSAAILPSSNSDAVSFLIPNWPPVIRALQKQPAVVCTCN